MKIKAIHTKIKESVLKVISNKSAFWPNLLGAKCEVTRKSPKVNESAAMKNLIGKTVPKVH